MKQPVFKLVNAATGQPVDALTGPVGSLVTLRGDFLVDPPEGGASYVWKAVPKACVSLGGPVYEPDFKREVTVNRNGALYVSAFDSNGFRLDSQTVKVRPIT